jgi:hypothetical protein
MLKYHVMNTQEKMQREIQAFLPSALGNEFHAPVVLSPEKGPPVLTGEGLDAPYSGEQKRCSFREIERPSPSPYPLVLLAKLYELRL